MENFEPNLTIIAQEQHLIKLWEDFPGGTVVKNPPASTGDAGSSPGPERSHMPQSN